MMNKKKIVENYFNNTSNYINNNAIILLRKFILNKVEKNIYNKQILDLGCGDGSISVDFLNKNHVTFVDLSTNMLNIVEQSIDINLKTKANLIHSSIEDFSSMEKFDLIICFGVLAHVENISLIFTKITKLLHENGTLYLQFSNWDSAITKIISLKNIIKRKQNYQPNKTTLKKVEKEIEINKLFVANKYSYFPVLPLMSALSKNRRFLLLKFLFHSTLSRFGSEIILKIKHIIT